MPRRPAYIIKQLEEGVDIGLTPGIEKHLPPEGLNRNNTSVNSTELKQALQKQVLEQLLYHQQLTTTTMNNVQLLLQQQLQLQLATTTKQQLQQQQQQQQYS